MPDIHGVTWNDIGRLGVDEQNNLYWDNKPLITRRKVTLPLLVNWAAILAGASTTLIPPFSFGIFGYNEVGRHCGER